MELVKRVSPVLGKYQIILATRKARRKISSAMLGLGFDRGRKPAYQESLSSYVK